MTKEELLKKIDFEKSWLYECGIFGSDVDIAFHAIKKSVIEALEQEPKTGHWEQYGNYWEDKFKCSECGKEQPKILCGERIIGHWSDYCPNCGAKMKG